MLKLNSKNIIFSLVLLLFLYFALASFDFFNLGSIANSSLIALLFALLYLARKNSVLFSLFLAILIIELALRFFSPYISYSERIGKSKFTAPFFNHKVEPHKNGEQFSDEQTEFNFLHVFNELGYKDENMQNQKKFKAFLLGDSFVQGVGVKPSGTIDKQLENLLACNNCILNMGLSGSNLINHYSLLQEITKQGYRAENIILNLNSTDIIDLIYQCKTKRETENFGRSLVFQYFYGLSFIFRHFSHEVLNLGKDLLYTQEREELKALIENEIYKSIVQYHAFCEEQNINFYLVFQALLHECNNKSFELESIREQLKQNNPEIKLIDLSSLFNDNCNAYYWPIDCHFNEKGYTAYSKALFDQILAIDSSFAKPF
ncbi:MAG: hypothetical protein H6579_04900 [Chitinophagales bacterium]|nr:hypothetical protein [Chitinophagales bacterium]